MIFPVSFEKKIEFTRIREMISDSCLCELGKSKVKNMAFTDQYEELCKELAQTEEMRKILLFEENFPQDHYIDSTQSLNKIGLEGTYMSAEEVHNLRKSIQTIHALIRFFLNADNREKYPVISKSSANVHLIPFIGECISSILDKEGKVKDNASPALKEIRGLTRQKQGSVNKKIQSILKLARKEGIVDSETEITIREGRPVIPVTASNKRKIGGFIHDESASGKTVYIEPAAVVEINNELRELEYAERREIIQILIRFANDIRPHTEDILQAFEFLGEIDFLRAKAKFALKINAIHPIIQKETCLNWRDAAHPLLYLSHKAEEKEIIPLEIELNSKNRILLISGPNAGGKSVCLKTTGLLQYMLQCGLLVPMKENSETCLFKNIFIDIGDEQSIENDLSTYSSHLLNMKHFVKHADHETLVLIDEFGTGTEPALGAAIAESILEKLNTLLSFGVITTHYANLKHFAAETDGITNGAMLFDTQKIKPLFKLSIGKPGSSFAIDIARKIGLPENILENATSKLGEDKINFDKHLREIIRDKKYWEEKRRRIRKVEKKLDGLFTDYNTELITLKKDKKDILTKARKEAEGILKDSNKKVEATIREIKESGAGKEKTRQSRDSLNEYRKQVTKEGEDTIRIDRKLKEIRREGEKLSKHNPDFKKKQNLSKKVIKPLNPEIGHAVKLKGYDTVGEILEVHKNDLLVSFGNMISTVKKSKIEIVNEKPFAPGKRSQVQFSSDISKRKLDFKSEIDVRGKRADEALAIVQDFIDNASMVSAGKLKILHGKGNGILRQLIRDYLESLSIVKSAKDAHADQGGAGITLVELTS